MRADNTGRGPYLGRDDLDLLFPYSANIDLNMNGLVDSEFCGQSAGQNVQVLEPLDDASDSAGISVGENPQPEYRNCRRTHEPYIPYLQVEERTPPTPGFRWKPGS